MSSAQKAVPGRGAAAVRRGRTSDAAASTISSPASTPPTFDSQPKPEPRFHTCTTMAACTADTLWDRRHGEKCYQRPPVWRRRWRMSAVHLPDASASCTLNTAINTMQTRQRLMSWTCWQISQQIHEHRDTIRALRPYLGSYYWQLFKSYISLPGCRIVSNIRDDSCRTLAPP